MDHPNTIRYEELVQRSLLQVVREALTLVAGRKSLPGNHHFYISFRTDHKGVKIPDYLRERHPEEITIVLQYQFWNLVVDEEKFSVELSFNGVHENLVVPFSSLTSFVDPAVKFGLQFTPVMPEDEGDASTSGARADGEERGKVISLDVFRKK